MNKHLSQPASQGMPPGQQPRGEQTSNTKKTPSHGATAQSVFKTDPNQQNQQLSHTETEKLHQ
ncbi:hypothetical protein BGZ80_003023, partial [Entomortierella chlamydospora]